MNKRELKSIFVSLKILSSTFFFLIKRVFEKFFLIKRLFWKLFWLLLNCINFLKKFTDQNEILCIHILCLIEKHILWKLEKNSAMEFDFVSERKKRCDERAASSKQTVIAAIWVVKIQDRLKAIEIWFLRRMKMKQYFFMLCVVCSLWVC